MKRKRRSAKKPYRFNELDAHTICKVCGSPIKMNLIARKEEVPRICYGCKYVVDHNTGKCNAKSRTRYLKYLAAGKGGMGGL